MARNILTALLLFISGFASFSQSISSIVASMDNINGAVNISYRLDGASARNRYKIELYCSEDKGITFSDALIGVSGDIGYNVKPGAANKINWAYFVDKPDFTGKNVVFKIIAKEDFEYKENMILALGGPEKFYQSVLIPGYGNYHVRQGKGYFIITGVVVGLLASGAYLHYQSQNYYDNYLSSTTVEMADQNFSKAKISHNTSQVLLGTGVAIWTIDVGQVIIKGIRNRQKQREILRKRQK